MTNDQIEAVARRVVEMLRAEREGADRAALEGLQSSLTAAAAEVGTAIDHLAALSGLPE